MIAACRSSCCLGHMIISKSYMLWLIRLRHVIHSSSLNAYLNEASLHEVVSVSLVNRLHSLRELITLSDRVGPDGSHSWTP